MLKTFPRTHLAAAVVIGVVVGTTMVLSPSTDVQANRTVVALDLESGETSAPRPTRASLGGAQEKAPADDAAPQRPDPVADQQAAISEQAVSEPAAESAPALAAAPEPEVAPENADASADTPVPAPEWTDYRIRSGDTLSKLFKKAGYNDGLMLSVIHGSGAAEQLQKLYAGETIAFAADGEGELEAIRLERNRLTSLLIEREDDGFHGKIVEREPEIRPAFASGVIDGSLYLAARSAGLDDRITMELAGIYGWDIDFVYDIRKGDRFEVVYEELYLDGEKFGTGKILAARFVNRGENIVALHYTDTRGDSDYFTPEGSSMRKAFLRTPINARVSSSFNLQRRHPVLDVVRPHEGTDYAAPPGTPIKAAGDGRVQFAGWKGGYGRTVILKHGNNITTLYAHMRSLGKGISNGTRVKQGQTIGYVGSSGMVTGPHLHYEFRVNNVARNSRTVDLPDAKPIADAELARFKAATGQLTAQLNNFREEYQQLALAEDE